MKIVLINSSVKRGMAYGLDDGMPKGLMKYLGGYQPLGICYIAAYLRKNGFNDLTLIDAEAEDLAIPEVVKRLYILKPAIVGISTLSFSFLYTLDLARAIKTALPDTLIIVGGSHVDIYPYEVLKHKCFDIGVIGEGEITFLEIVKIFHNNSNFLECLSEIAGIIYRKDDRIIFNKPREIIRNIDYLPFPARDLLNIKNYYQNYLPNPFISLLSSRGCPYCCTYCCRTEWNKILRFHSPGYVVEEIEYCIKRFKARSFQFFDDTFTVNKERVLKICELIKKRNLKIKFLILTRVDLVDRDIIFALKRAGCECISFGCESGDQFILDKMHKGYRIAQIKKAFALCREADVDVVAYFLLGHPDEGKKNLMNTIKLIKETKPRWCKANIFTLYPASSLYNEMVNKGEIIDYWRMMTVEGKVFRQPHINKYLSRRELEDYQTYINLIPYFRIKSNLFHFRRIRKPHNVLWSLWWLIVCLKNKLWKF